jgi:hypothetical protein
MTEEAKKVNCDESSFLRQLWREWLYTGMVE